MEAKRSALAGAYHSPSAAEQPPAATPPDEAGHRGSFTVPYEVMELHSAERPLRAPALSRDPIRLRGEADAAPPLSMLAAALLFIGLSALFLFSH